MKALPITFRHKFLQLYYLTTPVFLIIDIVWGINIRIPFLNHLSFMKYTYYTIAFACGIYTYKHPQKADIVGLLESSINIGILVIGFMLTYYNLSFTMLDDTTFDNPFTVKAIINFSLSGSIFLISYYRNSWLLNRRYNTLRASQ